MRILKIFLKPSFSSGNLLIIVTFLLSLLSHIFELDFGAFKRDYYEAHSLGMDHLNEPDSLIKLLKTIPNSASGVLPLYIYGLLPNLATRRIISYSSLLIICLIFIKGSNLSNLTKLNTVGTIIISPMIISATSYCLPEIVALCIMIGFMYIFDKNSVLSGLLAFTTFFNRQTFVVHLFNQIFIRKEKHKTIFYGILGFIGLIILYKIWGGLVPPELVKVHMTPSIKASINASLIFSLYFVWFFIKKIHSHHFNIKWAILAMIIAVLNISLPNLFGGGFIFSRAEQSSTFLSLVLEIILLYILLYSTNYRMKIIILVMVFSFITTNYMFLKYVDFYVICLLGYLHFNSISLLSKEDTKLLTQSIFYTTFSFFLISTIYYVWKPDIF